MSLDALPAGWMAATIGEVVEEKVRQDGPAVDKQFTYVDIGSIDNETKRVADPKLLAHNAAPSRARQNLATGDVLVSMTRPNLNAVAVVPETHDSAIGSTGFDVLRCRLVEPQWLFHIVQSHDFVQAMCRVVQGALYPAIRPQDIRKYAIPVPPLAEQRRIVAKVEELFAELDAAVVELKRVRANLKCYRASVLKAAVTGALSADWRAAHPAREPASALLVRLLADRRAKWEAEQQAKFAAAGKTPPKGWQAKYADPAPPDTTTLPALPDGWVWATVEQVAEIQGGVQKQPSRKPAANAYPFLRVANVHRDRLILDDIHLIELFGDELNRLRLQAGDMLIVEGNGSKNEIGRSAIWNVNINDCVHQNHIIRIRYASGSSAYLNCYWNSPTDSQVVWAVHPPVGS